MLAVINHRRQMNDLAERRLRTIELRTLCRYLAMNIQVQMIERDDTLMSETANLSLGTGTEPATPAAGNTADGAAELLPEEARGEDPDFITVGDYAPPPADDVPVTPLHRLGGLL